VCESECIRCERTRKKTKIADQEISENEEVGKISEDKKEEERSDVRKRVKYIKELDNGCHV
jgi:hypothetical protein